MSNLDAGIAVWRSRSVEDVALEPKLGQQTEQVTRAHKAVVVAVVHSRKPQGATKLQVPPSTNASGSKFWAKLW